MTYQIDKIRRDITAMQTDKGLQDQTDKFYHLNRSSLDEEEEVPPEEVDHL